MILCDAIQKYTCNGISLLINTRAFVLVLDAAIPNYATVPIPRSIVASSGFDYSFFASLCEFQKAIGFDFLRQRMVLVHLLRGHFLVQMVEVMELRGVVAETVQRNLPRQRFQSHDDAGETAARFQFPSVHPVPSVTPKLRVERALDVRFFHVLQVFFLLVLGKVTERFLVAGGEDEHFVFRFSETEVVDILDTDGGFLANVLYVTFVGSGVEADDGVVAVDFEP